MRSLLLQKQIWCYEEKKNKTIEDLSFIVSNVNEKGTCIEERLSYKNF